MDKKVILIGNGFNCSFRDYISDEQLKTEVNSIISLWQKFDKLIKDNREFIEKIIEDLHKSFALISLIKPFEEDKNLSDCIIKLKSKFNESFIEKLWEIVFEFIDQEKNGFYKKLTLFLYKGDFRSFNPCQIIKSKNINVYTTNYDGIAEIILGYNGNRFDLPDGFRDCNKYEYVCFSEDAFYEDINKSKLFHLHGSYKFFVYNTFTFTYSYCKEIKVRRERLDFIKNNKSNLEPIIVLNARNLKEKQIKRYLTLSRYLHAFEKDLSSSRTLIVWGQSLENDPHIERYIRSNFLRNNISDKKIVIIDINEDHKLRNLSGIKIEFINASQESFIDILKRVLNDEP